MPCSFEWYVQGRVIVEKFFGDVVVADLVRLNAEVTTLIAQEGVTPVHTIVDLTSVEKYPTKLNEVFSTIQKRVPEKEGWVLIVTENPILRFFASMVLQFARLPMRTFKTIPEAVGFLSENDQTLVKSGTGRLRSHPGIDSLNNSLNG